MDKLTSISLVTVSTYYYNPAYLYEAISFKEVQKPLEDFNHIAWFLMMRLLKISNSGSHKWAIESWKKQRLTKSCLLYSKSAIIEIRTSGDVMKLINTTNSHSQLS